MIDPTTPSEVHTPLPEIEVDGARTYIPLPNGWEVQTKGAGSTFRLCHVHTKNDPDGYTRWPVLDAHLHEPLEKMARDIHTAVNERAKLLERVKRLEEALRFYADERNHLKEIVLADDDGTECGQSTAMREDCGERARAALKAELGGMG